MEHTIKTTNEDQMIDITHLVQEDVTKNKIKDGVIMVYVPHTTAALTINENADPDVVVDVLQTLRRLVPRDVNYKHLEGNSHSHVKTSMFGSSEFVMIKDGKLVLGTWQSIFFCEFDGPRTRKFYTKIL